MNEKQREKYERICQEWNEWKGWEEGYLWEDGCDFFQRICEELFTILEEMD